MRLITLILLGGAAAVALAWWIAGLPGHVVVTVAGYTIDTAAPVAILGLLLIIAIVLAIVWLLVAILRTPRGVGRWRAGRRRGAGDAAVTATLVAIAAGDRSDALRGARRMRRLLGETPQTLLLAAEAHRLAGREDEAGEIYRTLAGRGDAAFLGLRGLFRQAVAREDWVEAATIARRAEQARPGAAWLREERAMLAVRTGNWSQALALSGEGAPTASYAVGAAELEGDPAEATRLARQAFRDNPGFVPAALAYARRLRGEGRESKAQDALRQAWTRTPHPQLAELALVTAGNPASRLRAAASLVSGNAEAAESHFLLARLNLQAGQVRDARRQLEAARAAGMNQRRLWLLLADLEAQERGTTEAGRAAQSEALRHAATAEPDPVWRCGACGTIHGAWSPACPVCHTPGRIEWTVPRLALPETTSGSDAAAAGAPALLAGEAEPWFRRIPAP